VGQFVISGITIHLISLPVKQFSFHANEIETVLELGMFQEQDTS
jgi:hypothetical protein